MLYKTIILRLLEERPQLHEPLQRNRLLLPTLDLLARELKDRHDAWKEHFSRASPECESSRMASQALEIALTELADRLPAASPPNDHDPLSLDAAMAYLLRPTSPG